MVVAEIYPRLFLQSAGHGRTKVRNEEDLAACFAALACDPDRRARAGGGSNGPLSSLSDHETDALIAAAGLRRFSMNANMLQIDGLGAHAASVLRREGWIFGVDPSVAAIQAASVL